MTKWAPWLIAVLALGCGDEAAPASSEAVMDTGASNTRDARVRVKERTVTIELIKTAERVLEQGADGELVYGPLTDIGGVEVCVAKWRPAFESFEPFEEIAKESQICKISEEGEPVRLDDLPANSDLVITAHKEALMPANFTFRTDEHDVGQPVGWGSTVALALVREGAFDPWVEPAAAGAGDGVALVWANAVWLGGGAVEGGPHFSAEPFVNVTPAEGVAVVFEDLEGRSVVETSTLRERPRFVALREGLYRVRFSHPRMNVVPQGAGNQYFLRGLSTERTDLIEVPILAGYATTAVVIASCAVPMYAEQPVEDLATCTLATVDGGAPP